MAVSKYKPGMPGMFAISRLLSNGDWRTAALLLRLEYRWRQTNKLIRNEREWIAESSSDWGKGSGLTASEMKNGALPGIKNLGFVIVEHWKIKAHDKVKVLWLHLDVELLAQTRHQLNDAIMNVKSDGGHLMQAIGAQGKDGPWGPLFEKLI
jgi:hypothetical protein